jgi:hypothetical protein
VFTDRTPDWRATRNPRGTEGLLKTARL